MRQLQWSNWFSGSRAEFDGLPMTQRERLAFEATGCEVAYPTWDAPVNCVHIGCQVRRAEVPRIALVNRAIRAEYDNWLRFPDRTAPESRARLVSLIRYLRRAYFQTGQTDIWQSWQGIVAIGVSGHAQ